MANAVEEDKEDDVCIQVIIEKQIEVIRDVIMVVTPVNHILAVELHGHTTLDISTKLERQTLKS